MDVPLTIDSNVYPMLGQAQLQLADQLKRMHRKNFAKRLLIGSGCWFAAVGVFAAGMKMQQVIDAQAIQQ
jgi:hypothetical protein